VLIMGGSLGTVRINDWVLAHARALIADGTQVLWPCGRAHFPACQARVGSAANLSLVPFLEDMAAAYAAADLVVAEAGGEERGLVERWVAFASPAGGREIPGGLAGAEVGPRRRQRGQHLVEEVVLSAAGAAVHFAACRLHRRGDSRLAWRGAGRRRA
jgi:hypothetical protein